MAGKNCQPVRGGIDGVRQIIDDAPAVLLQAIPLLAAHRKRGDPLGQLLTDEGLEPIAATIVGPKVQIQTQDRRPARLQQGKAIELFVDLVERRHGSHIRKAGAKTVDCSSPRG